MTAFADLRDPASLPDRLARPVVAIGNFDGLHRGHATVVERARALAARLVRPALILTFEPHPRAFFRPEEPFFRLTSPAIRARAARRLGLAGAVTLSFDAGLAGTPAEGFIADILVGRLGVAGVVCGEDFHFGRGRTGSAGMLRAAGAAHGFAVETVAEVAEADGERISSSAVREALSEGDVVHANRLLGWRWCVDGVVRHGEKRGRELGFPTANMQLDPGCGLKHGIYAVRAEVDTTVIDGAASWGRRPVFDNGAPLIETFLFDFSGDLYGKAMTLEFVGFIRGEANFPSVEALVRRMHADVAEAKAKLAAAARAGGPVSLFDAA
jgi:riboflavin kinase/FMN adenylyltransferase